MHGCGLGGLRVVEWRAREQERKRRDGKQEWKTGREKNTPFLRYDAVPCHWNAYLRYP